MIQLSAPKGVVSNIIWSVQFPVGNPRFLMEPFKSASHQLDLQLGCSRFVLEQ